MIETTTIAPLDYSVLIQQGITDAKGSVEEALTFLMPDDLVSLGRMLADRAAKLGDLFSIVVDPINNIALAIKKGKYSDVYDLINEERVPLQETAGAKRIYFVPVTENVNTGEEEAYVNKFGLTLCKKAPNYLAGAMAVLSEDKIPAELKGKDFVAAENETSSVFQDRFGRRCFLYVLRHDGKRKLYLMGIYGLWHADDVWMFLAEKP